MTATHLPADCLDMIFKNLEMDRNSLYSSILVNKSWCQSAIQILWNRNSISQEDYQLINLSSNLSNLSHSCLFNYPSFLRYLNANNLTSAIWDFTEIFDIHIKLRMNVERLIYGLIARTNGLKLLCVSSPEQYKELQCRGYTFNLEFINFLTSSNISLNNLQCIEIRDHERGDKELQEELIDGLCKLIKFQKCLKIFRIEQCKFGLDKIINTLEEYQFRNLINVTFTLCHFDNCNSLKGLSECEVLNNIHFENCSGLRIQLVETLGKNIFKVIYSQVTATNCLL
ncbi:5423_t:CDS:2 [Diversispora eburnea]|uniref:5423_t:CDS:1 n=1 Tax=Diversispora eburnea TaxID=1213867 RepID=A0A9N8ZCH5_9GLOM|nr:5423_t:CDS:2 [Diversispora eburnea]